MKKDTTYHHWSAGLLALLVLQAIVLKDIHGLLWHLHTEEAHCVVKGGETHLHSEEYAVLDCSICLYNFSPAECSSQVLTFYAPAPATAVHLFFSQNPSLRQIDWHSFLRGPPTCLT